MPKIKSFEDYSDEYDEWFIKNKILYENELEAIKDLVPENSFGLEVGVGSGKFSIPFGIKIGIDPSFNMAVKAKERGINVSLALAESLPFKNEIFDYILIVTSICFFDDVKAALDEAYRVLKNHGNIIIGFVNADSYLGKQYFLRKNKSKFYFRCRKFY